MTSDERYAADAAPDVPLILREPVRLYLYGLTVPVVALLVGLGLVNSSAAALIGAVAAAVFAVPVTEVTRRAVVSPAAAARVALRASLDRNPSGSDEYGQVVARAAADSLGVPGTRETLPLAA